MKLPALLIALTLAACSTPQALAPDNATVHVLAARPAPATASPRDVAIEVAVPRAGPGADTTDMTYTRGAYQLDRFAENRWVDTPSRMLSPLLVRALEDTGGFRAVVQAPSAATADYRLDTEVVRLVQNFATTPSRAEIAVRAQVTDLRTRRVVATRLFEDAEPSASENATGGVAAANDALARILSRIARFCVEVTRP
ncbi:MAG: ABC-type transport auxiliary lipoprotein family protein [Burkholderiales bacterium]